MMPLEGGTQYMDSRIAWLLRGAAFLILGLLMVGAAAACDDNGDGEVSEEERQELIDLLNTLAATNGTTATQEQIDFYVGHVTDGFVQEFGTESVAACEENAAECIGEPLSNPSVDPQTVAIDGDTATLILAADEGSFGVDLIKEGDVWKADGLFVPNDEIPSDTEVIELQLSEFAFTGDLGSDAVKSGDFAFHVTNAGTQVHEAVLVPLPAEGTLEEILQDESFEPQPIFVKFPYGPGEESDVALEAPLEPGRYAMVCFLPDTEDPEMSPHAFKGMVAEFTVE
jgi:hypothetical protein